MNGGQASQLLSVPRPKGRPTWKQTVFRSPEEVEYIGAQDISAKACLPCFGPPSSLSDEMFSNSSTLRKISSGPPIRSTVGTAIAANFR